MEFRKTIILAASAFCLLVCAPIAATAQQPATLPPPPSGIPPVTPLGSSTDLPPVSPLTAGGGGSAKAGDNVPAAGASDEYIVGPEDVIEIGVVGLPDRARTKVYTDGTIQMNLLGQVQVSGRTSRQIGEQIAGLLKAGGYYANPVVNVEVVSFASRYVTVLGAVGAPGLVPINKPYRLSEILARVGGVGGAAADYLVVRPEKGPEARYSINELATGDPSKDPFVQAGDKIYAPMADVFYISGQVRSPGTYPLKGEMTITQAIAVAGGLTESGSEKKVTTTRDGKKVKLKATDKIAPGEVVLIGERLF